MSAARADSGTSCMYEPPTFCRLCEAYCGIIATVDDGRVVDIKPERDNPHSQGHVCVQGIAMTALTNDPDRLLRPKKRMGGRASSRR